MLPRAKTGVHMEIVPDMSMREIWVWFEPKIQGRHMFGPFRDPEEYTVALDLGAKRCRNYVAKEVPC